MPRHDGRSLSPFSDASLITGAELFVDGRAAQI
jgi:hypothetical protein